MPKTETDSTSKKNCEPASQSTTFFSSKVHKYAYIQLIPEFAKHSIFTTKSVETTGTYRFLWSY